MVINMSIDKNKIRIVKNYLGQTLRINEIIKLKMEDIQKYRDRAKTTSVMISDMPKCSGYISKMEETIVYYLDMENKVWDEIRELNRMEKHIRDIISTITNRDQRIVLEMRFINFKTWEQISDVLGYGIRHVYRIRDEALNNIDIGLLESHVIA